jgi:hypothetical protein
MKSRRPARFLSGETPQVELIRPETGRLQY